MKTIYFKDDFFDYHDKRDGMRRGMLRREYENHKTNTMEVFHYLVMRKIEDSSGVENT